MSIELQTFKAGDEVYCPYLGRKVYKLDNFGVQAYPLTIEKNISFTSYGKISVNHLQPDLFHATPENKLLLEALYKCDFESPKLRGSDLTRKLLSDGAEAVLCYVSDVSDGVAADKKGVRVIFDYKSETDSFKTSLPNGSFQFWHHAVPCNDYANLTDGILIKSEQ